MYFRLSPINLLSCTYLSGRKTWFCVFLVDRIATTFRTRRPVRMGQNSGGMGVAGWSPPSAGRVFLFFAVIPKVTAPRESCRKLGFKRFFNAFPLCPVSLLLLVYTYGLLISRLRSFLVGAGVRKTGESQSGPVATQSTRYRILRWVPAYSGLQEKVVLYSAGSPKSTAPHGMCRNIHLATVISVLSR